MSLLRIFCPPSATPRSCQWVLFDDRAQAHPGEGTLAQLPQGAGHVELVLAASQVLITRVQLPPASGRHAGALLAYAIEEKLASDPDTHQVSRLGRIDADDVLAVVNRPYLESWREALATLGIHVDGVCCETLMLPLQDDAWSLAWNGQEGYVRTGELEGSATDCGDLHSPPLALQLLLEEARARHAAPAAIALYTATPAAMPDIEAWQQSLGIGVHHARAWNWRSASAATPIRLEQERRRWRPSPLMLARWRRVGWVLLAALVLHSTALLADRMRLGSEQQQLRQRMEARFRQVFPDAVAIADPALQMRRQLAQARHAANRPDDGDFAAMLGKVVPALKGAPSAPLRALSYEDGRMTLELSAPGDALVQQLQARLSQAGLLVDVTQTARPATRGTVTLTLRSP
jgi:general secretion pathway protein L